MAEGAISADLGRWQVPCLIFIGAADADFLEGARRAAEEIPDAELLVLEEADHYAAHMSQDEILIDAALSTLAEPNDGTFSDPPPPPRAERLVGAS